MTSEEIDALVMKKYRVLDRERKCWTFAIERQKKREEYRKKLIAKDEKKQAYSNGGANAAQV